MSPFNDLLNFTTYFISFNDDVTLTESRILFRSYVDVYIPANQVSFSHFPYTPALLSHGRRSQQMERINKAVEFLRMCWRYDSITSAGRRVQSLKIIGVAMIAVIGLLIFVVEDVQKAKENIDRANNLETELRASLLVASLIHRLQIERGLTVLCLGSKGKKDEENVYKKLKNARLETDKALWATEWPFDAEIGQEFLFSPERLQTHLNKHRDKVGEKCKTGTPEEQILFYTLPIDLMLDWFFEATKSNSQDIYVDLVGYYMFLAGKDKIGIERALGGSFFAKGHFNSTSHLVWFGNQSALGKEFLESSGKTNACDQGKFKGRT